MTDTPEPPRLLTMPEGGYAISRLTQSLGRATGSASDRTTKPQADRKQQAAHGPPTFDAVVESLLFVDSESDAPMLTEQLLQHLPGATAEQLETSIGRINQAYQGRGAPYRIASSDGGWRLAANEEYRAISLRLAGRDRETKLTKAALEVLSLVAYQGPKSGEELSRYRGKQSGALLRQLVRQGLLSTDRTSKESGRPARVYSATAAVAALLGLKSLDDLPRSDPHQSTIPRNDEAQVP